MSGRHDQETRKQSDGRHCSGSAPLTNGEHPDDPTDVAASTTLAVEDQSGWRTRLGTWFTGGDAIDRAFAVGIVLKGVNGIVEVVGGLLLLVATPEMIGRIATALTRGELAEDPSDFIATRLLNLSASPALTASGLRFAAAYLFAHGVVKVVLAAAILRGKLWAYPWMIGFLILFIGYQFYRIAVDPTGVVIALTALDLVLTWLAIREWQRHRQPMQVDRTAEDPPRRPALTTPAMPPAMG